MKTVLKPQSWPGNLNNLDIWQKPIFIFNVRAFSLIQTYISNVDDTTKKQKEFTFNGKEILHIREAFNNIQQPNILQLLQLH